MRQYCVYDIETYYNCFLFCAKLTTSNDNGSNTYLYEISDRANQRNELLQFLSYLQNANIEMVGFNNLGFDYLVIHELMVNPYTFDAKKGYDTAQKIIGSQKFGQKVRGVSVTKRLIPQIDLMKLNHFDNKAKMTSLKAIEFAMRSDSVQDLPYSPHEKLTSEQIDHLRAYNIHDVEQTEKFLWKCEHHIEMRREYLAEGILFGDVLNFSDVKIGEQYMINRLGKTLCYKGGKPNQTFRSVVEFKDIILPKIKYRTQKYHDVYEWFKQQRKLATGSNPSLTVELAGLEFHFGIGGVHASADNKIYHTTDTHQIIDIDVAGMYVAVAIANRFAPEHLGQAYVDAYRQIKEDRAKYPKGSSRNKALKLAGNGTYGNSNNPFSPFYDPKYTFSVTVNGQLQILQLVEMIDLIPDCELIQANTDGITVRILKENKSWFDLWCREWETMTGLELEEVLYSRMIIRDVNNYIAETMEGKLKRKGCYEYPITEKDYDSVWNKNFSNLASRKAAEKFMLDGWSIEQTLRMCTNKFDFMLRFKATGTSKLFVGGVQQLKFIRYYVSTKGGDMIVQREPKGEIGQYKRKNKLKDEYFNKIMEEIGPNVWDERIHNKKKTKYEITETAKEKGYKVKVCNHVDDFDWFDVDWSYYINEANKVIIQEK